jgi:hypothetical protein
MMAENVIPFPGREPPAAESTWRLITIDQSSDLPGWFDVCAWTGHPSDASSDRMYLGACPSFREAAEHARSKAKELGINEIADLSSSAPLVDPGAA